MMVFLFIFFANHNFIISMIDMVLLTHKKCFQVLCLLRKKYDLGVFFLEIIHFTFLLSFIMSRFQTFQVYCIVAHSLITFVPLI